MSYHSAPGSSILVRSEEKGTSLKRIRFGRALSQRVEFGLGVDIVYFEGTTQLLIPYSPSFGPHRLLS